MGHKESRLQADIVKALNKYPVYAFYVKNEGKKTQAQAMRDKAMGMRSGVSDLIILMDGKVLFMELKTATGKQSKTQAIFQSIVERFGFEYVICRSVDEAVKKIKKSL